MSIREFPPSEVLRLSPRLSLAPRRLIMCAKEPPHLHRVPSSRRGSSGLSEWRRSSRCIAAGSSDLAASPAGVSVDVVGGWLADITSQRQPPPSWV